MTGTWRAAVLTIALIAVAACSGSDDDTAEPPTTPEASTAPAPEPTDATATAPATTAAPAATAATTTEPVPTTPTTAVPTTEPESPTAPTIRSIIDDRVFQNLAHAGGDQAAPHSTRFAFTEAVRDGATMLELDVQLTGDGVLIVQHDDTVDKTTEATGPVSELTLAEIQALDNAYWFSPFCWPCQDRPVEEYVYRGVRTGDVPPPDGYGPDDFRVPTFREIATAFPALPLDIEIKGELPEAADVARQLARELAELDREDSAVVVSFDDAVVDTFRELAPGVAVSPGLDRLTAWFLGTAELEPHFEVLQLPPFQGEIQVIDATSVQRVHDEGRVVWVWPDDASTQENADFYEVLIEYGVDGIIAGRPAEVTAALDGAAG